MELMEDIANIMQDMGSDTFTGMLDALKRFRDEDVKARIPIIASSEPTVTGTGSSELADGNKARDSGNPDPQPCPSSSDRSGMWPSGATTHARGVVSALLPVAGGGLVFADATKMVGSEEVPETGPRLRTAFQRREAAIRGVLARQTSRDGDIFRPEESACPVAHLLTRHGHREFDVRCRFGTFY